jgi:hypothetical protein
MLFVCEPKPKANWNIVSSKRVELIFLFQHGTRIGNACNCIYIERINVLILKVCAEIAGFLHLFSVATTKPTLPRFLYLA